LSPKNNVDQLLQEALTLSEQIITQCGEGIYNTKFFQGLAIPEINIEVLEKRLIGILKHHQLLAESARLIVKKRDFQHELLGMVTYFLTNNQIEVFTAGHLNKCWTRFVTCKELCQIYLDLHNGLKDFPAFRGDIQVAELIRLHHGVIEHFNLVEINMNDKNRLEFLAFFMAIYLIFPEAYRQGTAKLHVDLEHKEKLVPTFYDTADAYSMPEFILRFYIKKMQQSNGRQLP
jgi:hypothetical protein